MVIDEIAPKVYCGPRPASYEEFAAIPVGVIINLEAGFYELFNRRMYEEDEWGRVAGKTVIHRPLSDFWAPAPNETFHILQLILRFEERAGVYFHCLRGKDRTGWIRALYRIQYQGWAPQKAKQEMLDKGFHLFPYEFWLKEFPGCP